MGAFAVSVAGPVRVHNEDSFVIDHKLGLMAVADGMGGHAAGEIASSGTLAAVVDYVAGHRHRPAAAEAQRDPDATHPDLRWASAAVLGRAVEHANTCIYQINRERGHPEGRGMGSTLTGLQFLPEVCAIALFHVGDSRAYRYRDGVLTQLTRDQTAYQHALESGAPDPLPPQSLLLQAIGPTSAVVPDLGYHDIRDGDRVLVCSDGLHGWVPHAEIEALLRDEPRPASACTRLVDLAALHGSRDNITALVAHFRLPAPVRSGGRPRIRSIGKYVSLDEND